MDSLSKKIQNLGIHDIRNAARFTQNLIVQYEPYQVDIRRATNTDSWGPTPKHLDKVLRNKYQVPLYLMTEYTLKRLVDHIATRPKNLYEKARKQYVNYGNEWRVVLKCLVVLEHLLLNVDSGSELEQVTSCLTTHKGILTRDLMQYRVGFSNDGKMEVHERGIKKKCEQVIQYIEDPAYLKRERAKHYKNVAKIQQRSTAFPQASGVGGSSFAQPVYGSYDDTEDIDDDFGGDADFNDVQSSVPDQRRRRSSALDEQRRQKREMLREKIKASELQRKASLRKAQEPQVDLLDFDGPEPQTAAPATSNSAARPPTSLLDDNDDDDEFGDFQSDSTPQPTAAATATSPAPAPAAASLDLLDWGVPSNSAPTTTASGASAAAPASAQRTLDGSVAPSSNNKDAFADLFSYSKSHI